MPNWRCPGDSAQHGGLDRAVPCAIRRNRRSTFRELQLSARPGSHQSWNGRWCFGDRAGQRDVHSGVRRTFCLPLYQLESRLFFHPTFLLCYQYGLQLRTFLSNQHQFNQNNASSWLYVTLLRRARETQIRNSTVSPSNLHLFILQMQTGEPNYTLTQSPPEICPCLMFTFDDSGFESVNNL